MKRLIVLRHAKSAWNTDAQSDHQRPLNKRGRRDAPKVAKVLAELGWVPDLITSSDAARTRETLQWMAPVFPDVEVQFTHHFYHAGIGAVQQFGAQLPDTLGTWMVVGHNPGWESVVSWLSGFAVEMTTCNAALLECDSPTWHAAMTSPGSWQLPALLRPKELAD